MAKKKGNIQPHWRPNFRITDTLPDIKAIRTDFLINFAAVTLALVLTFYVLQREYRIHALNSTIQELTKSVQSEEAVNTKRLTLSSEFKKASGDIVELEKFYEMPVRAHSLVAELCRVKPDGLLFNAIKFDEVVVKQGKKFDIEYQVSLAGLVKDPTALEAFKSALNDSEALNADGYSVSTRESLMSRDAKTGIFPYSLNVTLAPSGDKKGGK